MSAQLHELLQLLTKAHDGSRKAALGAIKPTKDFNDAMADVAVKGKEAAGATTIHAKELKSTTGAYLAFAEVLTASVVVFHQLKKYTTDYTDAAKVAMRGTTQLAAVMKGNVAEIEAATSANKAYGTQLQQMTGVSREEAMKMAVGIRESFAKAGHIDFSKMGKEAEAFSRTVALTQKVAGLSTDEALALQKKLMNEIGLSMDSTRGVMGHVMAAATEFGLSGSKSIEVLGNRMEELQQLEAADQAAFAAQNLRAAGLYERAGIDFGKHVQTLIHPTGIDAIKQAAFISSQTGRSIGEVLKISSKAKAGDAEAQVEWGKMARDSMEKSFAGFTAGERERVAGRGTLAIATQEAGAEGILKNFFGGLDDFNKMTRATERGEQVISRSPTQGQMEKQAAEGVSQATDEAKFNEMLGGKFATSLVTVAEKVNQLEGAIADWLKGLDRLNQILTMLEAALTVLAPILGALTGLLLASGVRGLFTRMAGGGVPGLPKGGVPGGAPKVPGVPGGPAGAGSLFSRINKAGGKLGGRLVVLDAAIGGAEFMMNPEGFREDMRKESEQGFGERFKTNLMRPGKALVKIGVGAHDAYSAYQEGKASEKSAAANAVRTDAIHAAQDKAISQNKYVGTSLGAQREIDINQLHAATTALGQRMSKEGFNVDYTSIRNQLYYDYVKTGKLDPDKIYAQMSPKWSHAESAEKAVEHFNKTSAQAVSYLTGRGASIDTGTVPATIKKEGLEVPGPVTQAPATTPGGNAEGKSNDPGTQAMCEMRDAMKRLEGTLKEMAFNSGYVNIATNSA